MKIKFAPQKITFTQKVTIYPQLVNISPEIILILQNMLIYVLFMTVTSRIYALFVAKSTSVPGLGGGRGVLSQFLKCQDFGSACHCRPSLRGVRKISKAL